MKKRLKFLMLITGLIGIGVVFYSESRAEGNRSSSSIESETIGVILIKERPFNVNLLEGELAKKQIQSFNHTIQQKKLSGLVTSCRRIIEIPVGTVHGNRSYGGICTLEDEQTQKIEQVMICNDEMVGHLKIYLLKRWENNVLDLSRFVAKNCTDG